MWLLLLPLKMRYVLLSTALAGFAASAVLVWRYDDYATLFAIPLVFFGFFSLLGLRDLFQPRHAILRNYPITAHLRFLFEKIRPEMRQYFFEDDKDGLPFPRDKRAIVYQRAKGALDKRPFGTQYDVYQIALRVAAPFDCAQGAAARAVPHQRSAAPTARSPIRPPSSTSPP